jgi:hypothetical protein
MTLDDLTEILCREIGQELAERVTLALCREAPGERLRIPVRPHRPEITPHDTPTAVRQRYNVSRATAHRWVAGWKR